VLSIRTKTDVTGETLLSARLKILRAQQHIKELATLLPDGALGTGYRFVVDDASKAGGRQLLKLSFIPTRGEASVILGEAIYQLRSTLDVATVAMARVGTPGCGVADVNFPFAESYEHLHEMGTSKHRGPQWKLRKLSPAARDVINNLHPYPGGNEDLVGLNTLRNEDAHIELNQLVTDIGNLFRLDPRGGSWAIGAAQISARIAEHMKTAGKLEDGSVIDVTGIFDDLNDAIEHVNEYMKMLSSVTFGNSKAFEGEPIIQTLSELCDVVTEVVAALEATI
jgi:hypothetical protein